VDESAGRASDVDDVAYQRLKNLLVIVAVYAVVLVAMIVLACRRRQTGVDYGPHDTAVSPAETAKPIAMPFRLVTRVDRRNHTPDGGRTLALPRECH